MKVVFAGKKRSGKDTAADYFKAWYGGTKFSFAEPLYDIMYHYQDTLGILRHKDRKFLTTVGDLARSTNPNIFIDTLISKVSNLNHYKSNVLVSDGRYENELVSMLMKNFILIQIVCDDDIRHQRLDPEDLVNDSHSSENGYPEDFAFHVTISNNGTLEEFHEKLKTVFSEISNGKIVFETLNNLIY